MKQDYEKTRLADLPAKCYIENMMMWIGFIVISVVGTLAHFLYDICKHNKFMALFAAVNESTWEHIKIALTPTLLWGLVDGFMYGDNPNYFLAKSISVLSIIILMPVIFYGYTAFTKKPILPIDIVSFYLVIFVSQQIFYGIIGLAAVPFWAEYLGTVLLFAIFALYMTATLQPLKFFIFRDPITNKYGKRAHTEMEKKK